MKSVARRLQLTRQAYGLKQVEFAAPINIATNTYNQYERGKKRPSIDAAIALCETYNLTLDWIYRGDASGLPYGLASAIKTAAELRHSPA